MSQGYYNLPPEQSAAMQRNKGRRSQSLHVQCTSLHRRRPASGSFQWALGGGTTRTWLCFLYHVSWFCCSAPAVYWWHRARLDLAATAAVIPAIRAVFSSRLNSETFCNVTNDGLCGHRWAALRYATCLWRQDVMKTFLAVYKVTTDIQVTNLLFFRCNAYPPHLIVACKQLGNTVVALFWTPETIGLGGKCSVDWVWERVMALLWNYEVFIRNAVIILPMILLFTLE